MVPRLSWDSFEWTCRLARYSVYGPGRSSLRHSPRSCDWRTASSLSGLSFARASPRATGPTDSTVRRRAASEMTLRARMTDASRLCRGSGLLIQDRRGVLQVWSVQPVREEGKNLGESGACLRVAAARLGEAREAERRPQLECAGALCASDIQSPVEVRLGRRRTGSCAAAQGQLTAEPVQFRFVQSLAGFSRQGKALVHDALALLALPRLGKRLG